MNKPDFKLKRVNLDAEKDKLLTAILNNTELMSELTLLNVQKEVIERNTGLLTDYIDALDELKVCASADKCMHENPYHLYTLNYNEPIISLHPKLCPYYTKKQAVLSSIAFDDFPKEYLDTEIKDLADRRNFKLLLKQLMKMLKGETNNIFVYGQPGIGKLKTVIPFLKRIIEDNPNKTFGVLDYPKFIRQNFVDYYDNKASFDNYLERIINVDYLVINKFGNEEVNKLIKDVVTLPLISGRLENKKTTIFIAEMSLSDVKKIYSNGYNDVRTKQIIDLISNSISEEIYLTGTKI